MDRPPHHCRVEAFAPGVGGGDYRGFLLEVCEVFTADVYRPVSEPAGHLRAQLRIGVEASLPRQRAVAERIWLRHASAAVDLQRGVKLPQVKSRLVGGGEQSLVAACQRLLAQRSAEGGAHVVETVGGSDREPLEERISGVDLHGVGERLSTVEVCDAYLGRVGVVVDYGLLREVCIVVFCIYLQCFAGNGNA